MLMDYAKLQKKNWIICEKYTNISIFDKKNKKCVAKLFKVI